jgi:hypothetical protein
MSQLDLFAAAPMAAVAVEPNKHGVYPDDLAETLTLPVDRKGWQGLPLAEVKLLHIPEGWLQSTSAQTSSGSGFGHGLCGKFGGGFYATRSEALHFARRRLLAFCIGAGDADHRKISTWAKALS